MKRGRKRIIQISPDVFEGMCRVQCTESEIAKILGCSIDTLRRWVRMTYRANFATVYANHAEVGKMSLRRAQMKSAVDELNPSMLKWLGQQYLNQRDKQDVEMKVTDERKAAEDAIDYYIKMVEEKDGRIIDRQQAIEEVKGMSPHVIQALASTAVQ